MTAPNTTFTKSNGSRFSKVYERLTKASRRRAAKTTNAPTQWAEERYRRGVYDTLKTLQDNYS